MNLSEIEWWNSAKEKFPDTKPVMEKVEKMSKAEREAINKEYQIGDDKTRDKLELIMQVIAMFRGHGLEKD